MFRGNCSRKLVLMKFLSETYNRQLGNTLIVTVKHTWSKESHQWSNGWLINPFQTPSICLLFALLKNDAFLHLRKIVSSQKIASLFGQDHPILPGACGRNAEALWAAEALYREMMQRKLRFVVDFWFYGLGSHGMNVHHHFSTHHLSNEKNPGCFRYIGDYTTQLYRDYNKPV